MGGSYGTIASAYGQQPKLDLEDLGVQSTRGVSVEPFLQFNLFGWVNIVIEGW